MDELVDDLVGFILKRVAVNFHETQDHFLYGHSMGGCISFHALHRIVTKVTSWRQFRGAVFSGPMFVPVDDLVTPADFERGGSCKLHTVSCCLGHTPGLRGCDSGSVGLEKFTKPQKPPRLSNYVKLQEATLADARFQGWQINLRNARNMLVAATAAVELFDQVSYPFIVLHAKEDKLCDHRGSVMLCERATRAAEHRLVTFEKGQQHELHNEEDWKEPLKEACEHYAKFGTTAELNRPSANAAGY